MMKLNSEKSDTGQNISFAKADDGCQIAVRTLRVGSGKLPPVMAIHALAMDGSMWSDAVSFIHSDVTVFAIDCRGHGQSEKPRGPYSTERFAKDVVDALDKLGHARAIIAGCSMGGTTALALAGRYPERVQGLGLFDTTAWYGEDAASKWEQRAQIALSSGMSALTEFQLGRWFSPEFISAHPEVAERALGIFLANDTTAYAETCRMLGRADERGRLGNYKGPAVLAVGEHDFATPVAMAEEVAKGIPQAKLTVIPNARHFTPFEIPEEIAARVEQVIHEACQANHKDRV
jgi:3-oxoadipate enol-lactonase